MKLIPSKIIKFTGKVCFSAALLLSQNSYAQAESKPATERVPLNQIVATVNDKVILRSEIDNMLNTIQRQLRQQGSKVPEEAALERQVLDKLIMDELQLQVAAENGIQVDEDTLNRATAQIAAQNKLSLRAFRDVLAQDDMSFETFRENLREQLLINRLRQRQVHNRISVSQQEIDQFLAAQKQLGTTKIEYRLGHILIASPEAPSPEDIVTSEKKAQEVLDQLREGADFKEMAITTSDGQTALDGGDLGWRSEEEIPTIFVEYATTLETGGISELIKTSSGFHIIKLIDKKGDQQHIISQTQVRHILVKPNAVLTEQDVRSRLTQLKERIDQGEDFGKLARSHSQDKGSAAKGGDLGWVNPGTMVPEFEKIMKQQQVNMISEPFQTQFGWHILEVTARREHDSSEEFNRSRAMEAIRKRKTDEELELWLRRLQDEAFIEYRTADL